MALAKKRTPKGRDWAEDFRGRLRTLIRSELGWSNREFARQLSRVRLAQRDTLNNRTKGRGDDVNPTRIAEWLDKDKLPRADTLLCIAIATGVDVDWLLFGDDTEREEGKVTPRYRNQSRVRSTLEADLAVAIERGISEQAPPPADEVYQWQWKVDGAIALQRAIESVLPDSTAYIGDVERLREIQRQGWTLQAILWDLKRPNRAAFDQLLPLVLTMKAKFITEATELQGKYALRLTAEETEIDLEMFHGTRLRSRQPKMDDMIGARFAREIENERMIVGALLAELPPGRIPPHLSSLVEFAYQKNRRARSN